MTAAHGCILSGSGNPDAGILTFTQAGFVRGAGKMRIRKRKEANGEVNGEASAPDELTPPFRCSVIIIPPLASPVRAGIIKCLSFDFFRHF